MLGRVLAVLCDSLQHVQKQTNRPVLVGATATVVGSTDVPRYAHLMQRWLTLGIRCWAAPSSSTTGSSHHHYMQVGGEGGGPCWKMAVVASGNDHPSWAVEYTMEQPQGIVAIHAAPMEPRSV